jgi:hypothetical protein
MATMKREDFFFSKYFKPADFPTPRTLRLDTVTPHDFVNDGVKSRKPVGYFSDPETGDKLPQGLILNATRWDSMVAISGHTDPQKWVGHRYKVAAQMEDEPDRPLYRGLPQIVIREPAPFFELPVEAAESNGVIPFGESENPEL